jgi:signal transduction histidine kinase
MVLTSATVSALCGVSFITSRVFHLAAIDLTLWLGLFGFASLPFIYRATRNLGLTGSLFNLLAFTEMAIAITVGGGMGSVFSMWLPLFPVIALAVTGPPGAMGAMIALVAFCGVQLWAGARGLLPPPLIPMYQVPLDVAVIVVMSSLVNLITAYTRERAMLDIHAQHAGDERALARAEAAGRAKSGILASVSQELRTPMTGILGLADAISETKLDPKQAEWIRTIRTTGGALLALLDDLLDSARLDAGTIELRNRAFRPHVLARQVVALFEPEARGKGLELVVDVSNDVPARLRGDPARIRQVLINLVANAVKFTDSGTVSLSVRARGETLVLWVSDTGIGIARERLDAIFSPFTDAEVSSPDRGMGLGLSISRLLVQAMGGTLEVESRVGAGSTFWVRLPLVNATVEDDPTESTSNKGPSVAALRVLVAEDDEVNQLVIRSMLEGLGHAVEVIGDGETIVAAARVFQPDVVLVDVRMRRVGGIEATRRLRNDMQFVDLPIIAMTANAFDDDRHACEDAGVTGFLEKPVVRDALHKALRSV